MNNDKLESLFGQSNTLLFNNQELISNDIKDIVVARLNLAKSITITNNQSSEFESLIKGLQYSLDSSDDMMALSLIHKINYALVSITDSFDSISNIVNKLEKK